MVLAKTIERALWFLHNSPLFPIIELNILYYDITNLKNIKA